MALPITVPYTFGTATTAIPLSNLDSDYATVYQAVNGIGNGSVALANVQVTGVGTTFPNNYLANSSVTIGNTAVALGSTVTSFGNVTLTNATISSVSAVLTPAQGGTGVNNGSNTITIAGNVTHSGAFTQTFTATGNTSLTLPTSGTLQTTTGSLASNTGLPLTTGVTGTLPVANGGTNLTSFTANGVVYASSTSALATSSAFTFNGTDVGFTGNLVPGTAAKGINFTANTPASGMTSQLLNWYEQGTWTPTDGSGAGLSLSVTYARYTRIGRLITIETQITYPATASAASAVINGLPFTVVQYGVCNSITNASVQINGLIGGTQSIYLRSGLAVDATNAQMSLKYIIISGSYSV